MKRYIALLISASLLALLFWHVDTRALAHNLASTRWWIFGLALLLFVPQTLVISWRWKQLVAPFAPLPLPESVRMVLAGSTMNLVLPGKMGDLMKGWFLAKAGTVSTSLGVGVVVFEKMLDVAALAVFMLIGVAIIVTTQTGHLPLPMGSLLLASCLGIAAVGGVAMLYFVPLRMLPGMAWLVRKSTNDPRLARVNHLITGSHRTMNTLRDRGARRGQILFLSLTIWILHLTQIYLFFLSLGAAPAAGEYFSMVPLAIFIGLLPISIAGFGTRDAALVTLLPSLAPSAVLAAAMYINLRYIIPAAAGVGFLTRYAVKKP